MIDYSLYELNKKEKIKYYFLGIMISLLISWIFFRSIIFLFCAIPLSYFFVRYKTKLLKEARISNLNIEFIDFLMSINDSLKTGSSLEIAFKYAKDEILKTYGDKSYMYIEAELMVNKIGININPAVALSDFATRTGISEIILFADILSTMKSRGGNLIKMVRSSIDTISNILDTKKEINMTIASKVNEKRVMDKIPLVIICYIYFTSPDIIMPLYQSIAGRILMLFTFIIYGFAFYLGEKIVDIKI